MVKDHLSSKALSMLSDCYEAYHGEIFKELYDIGKKKPFKTFEDYETYVIDAYFDDEYCPEEKSFDTWLLERDGCVNITLEDILVYNASHGEVWGYVLGAMAYSENKEFITWMESLLEALKNSSWTVTSGWDS